MLTLLIVFGEGLGELEDPLRRGGGPGLPEPSAGRAPNRRARTRAGACRRRSPASARRRSPLRLQAATAAKRLSLLVAGHGAAPVDVAWLPHDHEMPTVCDSSTLSSVRAPWSSFALRSALVCSLRQRETRRSK
jgi:hypothetical protein